MVNDVTVPELDTVTSDKPLTKKEKRAKANREAQLKKPIVSPTIFSNPFDFVFFTWFGPILRLVSALWSLLSRIFACPKSAS